MAITSFTQLDVWRKARALVLNIYAISGEFPPEEKFVLVDQVRRAAVSIPANIAEGFGRRHVKDKVRFYTMSVGSLEELRYYIILARDLGYVDDSESLMVSIDEVRRMLNRLISVMSS